MAKTGKAAALRQAALDSDDLGGEYVHVPAWGKDPFWVRGLTAQERNSALVQTRKAQEPDENGVVSTDEAKDSVFYAFIVIRATLDGPGGDQVFSVDDLPLLLGKNASNVDLLANPILRLSGMAKADVQEAVNEAGKESTPTPSGDGNSR